MQLHSPNPDAARLRTRRLAYASALAGVALAGVVGLGLPRSAVLAQKADVGIQMPGRAPLSFADIVERVKPAVVSINVTNGGPKVAQGPANPKGATPKGFNPKFAGVAHQLDNGTVVPIPNDPKNFGCTTDRPVDCVVGSSYVNKVGFTMTVRVPQNGYVKGYR